MTLSNEEKRKIMDELAQGKPGVVYPENTPNLDQHDSSFDAKDYENFDAFAQRSSTDASTEVGNNANLVQQIREQIRAELQQAKAAGQLRSSRIREIVQSALSQVRTEVKAGSGDIRQVIRDTISAVSESVQEKGGEIKEEVTAAIEGFIEGYSSGRRQAIAKNQAEVKQIQIKIDTEEEELQKEIDRLLVDVEEVGKESSPKLKDSVVSAINAFKNSEEFALLKKRYAQLQAQAAILRANLAARYGGRYEEIQEHLEEARNWYHRTHTKAEAGVEQTETKGLPLEERLREAGDALSKKERQIRKILSDLLQAAADLLREKEPPAKSK